MDTVELQPYIVSWNLTKRCNLSCPHCYIESDASVGHAGSELSREEARFVIDELSYLNKNLMLILSGGEPMLREDIFEIVEETGKAGFITVLGSNGTLLTRESLRTLKAAGLRGVGISIDSHESGYHDSFRGLHGSWDLSIKALNDAKEAGLETLMDVTLTEKNWMHLSDFVELGASLSVKAVNFFFLICTGRAMKMDISTEHYDKALRQITSLFQKERRLMVRARCAPHIYRVLHEEGVQIPEGTKGCLAGRQYMRIDPEGNITPCPYMPLVVGNVREKSLPSLWENAPYLKLLRKGNYKGRCGTCEYSDLCGGCRARAMTVNGDFMGEDSFCDYVPKGNEKVKLAQVFHGELEWTGEARARIKKAPFFMQSVIVRIVEEQARKKGITRITSEFIDEIKRGNSDIHRSHTK